MDHLTEDREYGDLNCRTVTEEFESLDVISEELETKDKSQENQSLIAELQFHLEQSQQELQNTPLYQSIEIIKSKLKDAEDAATEEIKESHPHPGCEASTTIELIELKAYRRRLVAELEELDERLEVLIEEAAERRKALALEPEILLE